MKFEQGNFKERLPRKIIINFYDLNINKLINIKASILFFEVIKVHF